MSTTSTPPAQHSRPSGSSTSGTKKSSAARRNALREFYKLSSNKPETIDENEDQLSSQGGNGGSGDDNEKELDIYMASAKDKANAVDTYVTRLVEQHDLRGLLKQENVLVGEIRTLDSEGKALVYNNYSKLTAASTTLHSLQTEVELLMTEKNTEELKQALNIIAKEAGSHDSLPPSSSKSNSGDIDHPLPQLPHSNTIKAAKWITQKATQTIQNYITAGNKQAALDCATKSQALLDRWIQGGELDKAQLQKIKQEIAQCTSVLDVEI